MPPRPHPPDASGAPGTAGVESPSAEVEPDSGVDETLIRWMLSLTPTERLQWAQDMADTLEALREGREP